jgi:hypothetical protein
MPRDVRAYYDQIRRAFPRIKASEAHDDAVILARADARDLVLVILDDTFPYELGEGETEVPRDVYCVFIYRAADINDWTGLPLDGTSPYACLGSVGTNDGPRDPYIQLCLRAQLSDEALDALDAEDAAHAADLAARATYAAGGQ